MARLQPELAAVFESQNRLIEPIAGLTVPGAIPSLPQMLATAKLACSDPGSLSQDDIVNLAKVVLIEYAAMGIR